MHCTVAELGDRLSARELVEWQLYAQSRPFGEEQEDRRAALIAHTVASVFGGKKAPDLNKFLAALRPEPESEPQSADDLRSRMLGLANRKTRTKPKQEPEKA